jgi:hypothetical protein
MAGRHLSRSSWSSWSTLGRMAGMNYSDASHRKAHEHQVIFLARIIEVRKGDDEGYANRFLGEIIRQAKPRDKVIAARLAADVDAWLRARRTYRYFFE